MKHNFAKSISNIILLTILLFLADKNALGQLLEIKNKIPKNVPIKIEFKNQDSKGWAHKLEIKITNTGEKPIYYLGLNLALEEETISGAPTGYSFSYGGKHLYSAGENLAQEGDIPILPNETYTFKINKKSADGRKYSRELKGLAEDIQKAAIELVLLNFGDGSGIMRGGSSFKKKF